MDEQLKETIETGSEETTQEEAVIEAIRKAREEAEAAAEAEEAAKDAADGPDVETEADAAEEEKTAWEEVLEDAQEERAAEDSEEGVKEPKQKASARDAQIEDLTDRLKRQMAEFENFRKRTEREKSQMFDMGARHVIEHILPVIDNFERGLAGVDPETADAFTEGMQMVYRQLMAAFTEMGVEPIEAVGQPFDPELHNAVMHIDDEAFGENEVAEEFQKGYKYHDAVVRHSMVKVAN